MLRFSHMSDHLLTIGLFCWQLCNLASYYLRV